MSDLLLRGGRVRGGDAQVDILVRDGVVEQVAPGLAPVTGVSGAEVIEVRDRLVLPGLVEAHCHLDKTLYGAPWVPHSAGDALADRIANERRRRGELGLPDVERVTALLERMVATGKVESALGLLGRRTARKGSRLDEGPRIEHAVRPGLLHHDLTSCYFGSGPGEALACDLAAF